MRERRVELKLSIDQVAAQVGVKYQQVQKYESGLHQMNMSMAQRMAHALKVTLDYFVKKPGS
jgi:transcriptional regulator with XRE-family HTH domain